MMREMLKSKIHRAVVTGADLHYVGSLEVDSDLLAAADLLPSEKVQVVNLDNGARFETYVIPGAAGQGQIRANGGAAHLAKAGDLVLIISYCHVEDSKAATHVPRVIFVDDQNRVAEPATGTPSSP